MTSYIRYQQVNRLRDKSSLFFLCSFILVVVYTSAIGFVIVHVLKITKNMEDRNQELLKTNKLLEDKLEKLILRLEIMEEKMATRNSSVDDKAYAVAITDYKTSESHPLIIKKRRVQILCAEMRRMATVLPKTISYFEN
ncbi:hypothetical protein P5673_028203 [Acropora cervicornis]|uniref:Uncharacterized protein n=1 Tax=Acropora cervicornis TaxID=6130 RepID=A0AAD9UVC4_ACRCE|nr:hypothetical protein P5673_028203 [Acropora cervicornis]